MKINISWQLQRGGCQWSGSGSGKERHALKRRPRPLHKECRRVSPRIGGPIHHSIMVTQVCKRQRGWFNLIVASATVSDRIDLETLFLATMYAVSITEPASLGNYQVRKTHRFLMSFVRKENTGPARECSAFCTASATHRTCTLKVRHTSPFYENTLSACQITSRVRLKEPQCERYCGFSPQAVT
jgi:hypothetical protein